MANELIITASMSFTKGVYTASVPSGTYAITVTGTKYLKNVQNIGITIEALEVGDIVTPGFIYAINRDLTNYVELFDSNNDTLPAVAFAKLKAGEFCIVRLSTVAPYAKANTGAVNLEYLIIED